MVKPKTREEKIKEAEKDFDYLKQVETLPNEKGRKFVHDVRIEEKTQQQKKDDSVAGHLDGKGIFTYLRAIADYGQERVDNLDLGKNWDVHCIPTTGQALNIYGKKFETKEGIAMVVKAPSGKIFIRAVLITKNPEIDMKAINILTEQVENTADYEKGILLTDYGTHREKKTKSGIILP